MQINQDDINKNFLLNKYKNLIKTDKGYALQNAYVENDDGSISEVYCQSFNRETKNCYRCIYSNNGRCCIGTEIVKYPMSYNWVANCDAYKPLFPLNIIKSESDMISLIENSANMFDCVEDYEWYFGFERKWNEETGETLETVKEYYKRGGKFTKIPTQYPCVIYFGVVDFDYGTNDRTLQWIYIGE